MSTLALQSSRFVIQILLCLSMRVAPTTQITHVRYKNSIIQGRSTNVIKVITPKGTALKGKNLLRGGGGGGQILFFKSSHYEKGRN